jgi:phosphoribosylamine-glycine ligase
MVKVLILGVGNAQVDALRYLKEMKCITYGLSHAIEGRGLKYCDHFDVIDIKDRDKVLAYAERNKVEVVYSVGSDVAMPTIGYVGEKLGLPYFCNENIAILLNNKFLFRSFLMENNLLNISFQSGKHWKDFQNWHKFPAIIKPVCSQGQRGIRRIENKNDIRKHIKNAQQFSESGEIILEEFITGAEISANIFLKDGRIFYSFISDRMVYEELDGGLVKSHIFPTKMNKDLQTRALQLISNTVKHLNIQNGPVYFQMMYNSDDVHIIEVTPRLDGCHIWRLIRSFAGIDLLKLTFDMLLRETIIQETIDQSGNIVGLHFFSQKPNMEFKTTDFNVPEETKYHEFYYKNGQMVRPLNKVFEKVGYYIK